MRPDVDVSANGSAKEATRAAVRSFMTQYFGPDGLSDDENIFATGFVNSMFVMRLVSFVESDLGVVVEDQDLEIGNFSSIEAIAALVARKRGARSS